MDLSSLSIDETARLVAEDLDMPTLADLFREQDVDGSVLVELTAAAIREFLPTVTLGQCVKLFSRLEKFRKPSTVEVTADIHPVALVLDSSESATALSDCPSSASIVAPPSPATPDNPAHGGCPNTPANEEITSHPITTARQSPVSTVRSSSPVPREFPIDRLQLTPAGTNMIETGDLTIAGKTAITNAVVVLIQKYSTSDGYASHALKRMAATALVYKYPRLSMGMGVKDAVDAWHRAFSQKLVNWRKRGKVVDPTMEEMKTRYQRNRTSPTTPIKRKRQNSVATELVDDEVHEQTEMKEVLMSEMAKPIKSRNQKVLDDLTSSSFLLRRQFVLTEGPHARLLGKEWPSLKIELIMMKEFHRIAPNVAKFQEFLSRWEAMTPRLVDLAREKASKYPNNHPLCSLMTKIPHLEASDPDYDFDLNMVGALVGLSYLLPTTAKKLVHPHRYLVDVCGINTPTEDVRESVTDRDQPFMQLFGDVTAAERIVVFADKTPMISCKTIPKALYIVLAMHYVLNIEFSNNVSPTLEFVQAACLSLNSGKLQTRVRELLQKMD